MSPARVFVDTGAWVALQVPGDAHHRTAAETLPELVQRCQALVTSNHVVGETYTVLRRDRGHEAARRFLDGLLATAKLERHFIGEALERDAYQLLHRYSGHPFSFVDGTSFALMRQQRIRFAFAFNTHFATAGFVRIPMDFTLAS